jgi:tRNA A37 methylthiotransferase MiaB
MIPHVGDKFKQLFEINLRVSVGGCMVFLSNKCSKTFPKVLAVAGAEDHERYNPYKSRLLRK